MNPVATKEMYTVFKPTITNIESMNRKIKSASGSNESSETKKRMVCLLKIISEIGMVPMRRIAHTSNKGMRYMHQEQGRVFQSNPYSFTKQHDLYIVGLNPNSYMGHTLKSGKAQSKNRSTPNSRLNGMKMTIDEHTTWLMMKKNATRWSAYLHEQMGNPDSSSLKDSFIEFFNKIGKAYPGITAYSTPCTNIVFIRTNNEDALTKQFEQKSVETIVDMCWKFHKKALSYVRPKVIMTFSSFAKNKLMEKLGGQWISAFSCKVPLKIASTKCIQYEVHVKKNVSNPLEGSCNIILYVSHPSAWDWTKSPLCPSTVVEKILAGSLFTTNKNICPATPENVKRCEEATKKKSRKKGANAGINGTRPMNVNKSTESPGKRKRNNSITNENLVKKQVRLTTGRNATMFVKKKNTSSSIQ